MSKKLKEKRVLAPLSSRYMASLSVEEDEVIRKAAKTSGLSRGAFIRAAAVKMAAEYGYYLGKPDNRPREVESAWADAMK